MTKLPDPMAEIRASFFVECEELLEGLHDALRILAGGGTDAETINVAFRAVHSIKGGAGAFGLTALVAFAHRFESVMDALRSGRLAAGADLVRHLVQAADLLADQVGAARIGSVEPEQAGTVLRALEAFLPEDHDGTARGLADPLPAFQPVGLSFDFGADTDRADAHDAAADPAHRWTIAFTPTCALYASGNEPLLLLRALASLGTTEVICDTRDLPTLDRLDAEESYLRWTINLVTGADEAAIRDVFDFVTDVAGLTVMQQQVDCAASADARGTVQPEPAKPPLPGTAATGPDHASITPIAETAHHASGQETRYSAPTKPATATLESAGTASATVRVDLDRIDRLVNLVGELVINQAMLTQSVTESGLTGNAPVMSGLDAFMVLTRDIQESVMTIRAQPIKPLFQRMARIVREAAAAVGKEVRLLTEGEATEIDKTVIERLADPLTHMIRNAVDHGLEHPDDRRAAGKPLSGTVTLAARHRSGRVIIDLADDGAGIDRARVLDVAIRKGLVAAEASLSEEDIDALLFMPGFSTATAVSNLSGRGVGMDVVNRAIQSLGGRITIRSERGRGTSFSISLPLTLAVMDGMVIEVAGQTLVMPLSAVTETAALRGADMRRLGQDRVVACLRGVVVPVLDLGVQLGFREPLPDYDGATVLLTLLDDGSKIAFVVDGIVEQRQVVIKGLEQSYDEVPGVAAATILGNGRIALILDPADAARLSGAPASGRTVPTARVPGTNDRPILSMAG
jgi:two-component system, chemotaxis family, sensor kinase CheA